MGLLTAIGTSYGAAVPTTGAKAITLTVANGAVYVQLGRGIGSQIWGEESFRVPGVHVIPGPVDAVRVRAAVNSAVQPVYAVDGVY